MLTCGPAAVVPLDACSPYGPREGIGAERLPAVGPAFFDDGHEAVVGQRVAVGIRQQEAASGGAVDEHRTPARAAVGERPRLLAILAADVRPSDEVVALLAHVRDRHRERRPSSRSTPIEYSSVRGARVCGIEQQVDLGSTTETMRV